MRWPALGDVPTGHGLGRAGARRVVRVLLVLVVAAIAAVLLGGCGSGDLPPTAACTVNWVGQPNDDFSLPAAWDTGVVPGPADVACAPTGSSLVVSSAQAVDGANLEGLVTITGLGTLRVSSNATPSFIGDLDLQGALDGPGVVSIGQLSWRANGRMTGDGLTFVANYGPSTIDGSVEVHDAHVVNLLGDVTWNQGDIRLCDDATLGVLGAFRSLGTASSLTSVGCASVGAPHAQVAGTGTWTVDSVSVTVRVPLENDGNVVIPADRSFDLATYAQTAGTTTLGGPTASIWIGGTNGTFDLGGGTLAGTGSVFANLSGAGTLAPTVMAGPLRVFRTANTAAAVLRPDYGAVPPPANLQPAAVTANVLTRPFGGLDLPASARLGYYLHTAYVFANDCDPTLYHPNANLTGADLSSRQLGGCDLGSAILLNANLASADLTDANLRNGNIAGANLTGTTWSNTTCPDGTNSDANGATCANHGIGHTYAVNTTSDLVDRLPGDGLCAAANTQCSLRAAIMEADAGNGNDTINLPGTGTYSLTLAGADDTGAAGDLDVNVGVTVNGNGSVVRQTTTDRVLDVHAPGAQVRIEGVALQGGNAGTAVGGGVRSTADLTLVNSAVTNTAGIGAALDSSGPLTLVQSTISDNAGVGVSAAAAVDITDATITTNTGGGIVTAAGPATVTNSIIAEQLSGPDCSVAVTSGGFNLSSDSTCGFSAGGDLQGTDPGLGGLTPSANHPLHLPTLGSPAVDSGRPGCGGPDARGVTRPQDGDGDTIAACDRGAAELAPPTPLTLAVTSNVDSVDANPGDGLCRDSSSRCTLRAAVMEANATNGADTIDLQAATTYTLSLGAAGDDSAATGDLDIATPLLLHGNGSTVNLGASTKDRVFDVYGGPALVTIDNVTVTGADVVAPGAIRNRAHLVLTNAKVRNNTAGGVVNAGTADVSDSFITTNTAEAGGGVANLASGTVHLARVQLTGNQTRTAGGAGAAIVNDGVLDLAGATVTSSGMGAEAVNSGGTLTAHTVTLSDSAGAGLRVRGGTAVVSDSTITANGAGGIVGPGGTTTLTNSIVADQQAGADCAATVTSGGHNATSDASCALAGTADVQNAAGLVAPLTTFHALPVHLPLPGSVAIDSGAPTCAAVDVRGAARPQAGASSPTCDRGAVELAPPVPLAFTVNNTQDGVDADPGDGVCQTATPGQCTLRAAIMEANATNGADSIDLAPGATYVLSRLGAGDDGGSTGDLDIHTPLVLDAHGATLEAQYVGTGERALDLFGSPMIVDIRNLTVQHGQATAPGAIRNRSDLTLTGSAVTANSGGALVNTGSVTLVDSSVTANQAPAGTAAAITNTGQATLLRTSVAFSTGATEAVTNAGALTLDTASITGNAGAGVRSSAGAVSLVGSTITGNAGGVVSTGGTVQATSSVIAAQTSGSDCSAPITSGGYNLASDASCALTGPADLANTPAGLSGAMAIGRQVVNLPVAGSPAIDSGPATCGAVDVRQLPRPLDGDGNGTAICDRGAAELAPPVTRSFTVTSTADAVDANPGDGVCQTTTVGECTLRAAIMEATASSGADTIELAPATTYVLGLTGANEDAGATGDLDLGSPVVLNGHGSTIRQSAGDRVLDVFGAPATTVELHDLTITGGGTGAYATGALFNRAGLTANGLVLTGNRTALVNDGALTLIDSQVVANTSTADSTGAGINNRAAGTAVLQRVDVSGNAGTNATLARGAGILNDGDLTLTASSVSANRTAVEAISNRGTLTLDRATVADNTTVGLRTTAGVVTFTDSTVAANAGFGLVSGGGSVTATNSVVANPTSGANCSGAISSGGYNLATDASCGLTGPADLSSTPVILLPLRTDGPGAVKTRLPKYTSAAVDSGRPGCSGPDARGQIRPADGNGDADPRCDRGAAELAPYNPLALTVNATTDAVDATPGDGICQTITPGQCTLRAALMESNASVGPDTIDLAPTTYPLTIAGQGEDRSTTGDLDTDDDVTIHGNGATIDGNLLDRVWQIVPKVGATVVASDLTITRGQFGSGASGLDTGGDVTLTNVTFTGNATAISVVVNQASLTLDHSTVATNASNGVISLPGATLAVVDATIADNTVAGGTVGLRLYGPTTITRSTISGHQIGIGVSTGPLTITSSTLSGNGAAAGGVTLDIYAGVSAQIVDSTFVNAPAAMGIRVAGGAVTSTNSVFSGGVTCAAGTTVTSGGYNLAPDTSCAFSGPSDVVGAASLGPLAANGGPTKTHLPALFSAPVDSGKPGCSGTDQRGVARPQGAACDRGAVEQ